METSEVSKERAIAAAARELVQLRDNWLNPLPASPDKSHPVQLSTGELGARWAVEGRIASSPVDLLRRGRTEVGVEKRTLTNLYNERPTWLDNAHRKLDAAVFDAYGWPHDLNDEEILSKLLALNLERAYG